MKPFYEHAGIRIYVGDCREVIPQLQESFDACVTDPPYHLTTGKKGGSGPASVNLESPYGRARIGTGFMGKAWDGGDVAFRPETWEAVSRVLKPGAHVMAFGGTRTFHRLACAIEDAGFDIRDTLMWLYGSGFPKSLDISKAIDKSARGVPQGGADPTSPNHGNFKSGCSEDNPGGRGFGAGPGQFMKDSRSKYDGANRKSAPSTSAGFGYETKGGIQESRPLTSEAQVWDGYGTALKPAWEPIILGMRPCDGTFAENALEHGVAGMNVDGSRIATDETLSFGSWEIGDGVRLGKRGRSGEASADRRYTENGGTNFAATPGPRGGDPAGRWPANLILDEEAAALLDDQAGDRSSTRANGNPNNPVHQDIPSQLMSWGGIRETNDYRDSGGASRFFYTAKADSTERGTGNNHPTVKPLDLMRYLCKLLAPPSGGLFLEPFAGSGTTLIACKALNIRAVGIELSEEYAEIAAKRLSQDVLELI